MFLLHLVFSQKCDLIDRKNNVMEKESTPVEYYNVFPAIACQVLCNNAVLWVW